MNNTKKSISVIMPAFNEEHSLEKAALHTLDTFRSMDFDFEMIIVNDSSLDRTGEIAEKIASTNKNVRVIHHKKNKGIGGAFRTGIDYATKEHIIFVPVDSPIDIEDMHAYIPWLDICDIVVGSRVERVGYGRVARFASFVYNKILVPVFFNISISDVNWIQIYRRSLFTDGNIKFNPTKIFFLVEILVQARRNQLIMVEVPAKMKKRIRGKPTSANFFIILETFCDMMKFFWKIRKEEK